MGLWAFITGQQAEEVFEETVGDTADNLTPNAKAIVATEWLAATGLSEEAIKTTLEETDGDGTPTIQINVGEIKDKYR